MSQMIQASFASNYYRHVIYCDLNYRSLISFAANYFVSKRYINYSSGKKFANNKETINLSGDSAYFTVVYAKMLIDVSGTILVSADNLKGRFTRKEITRSDLPVKASQKFKNYPNVLIIDINARWLDAQYHIVREISQALSQAGHEVYDNTFNGYLLGMIDTIKDPDKRIGKLNDIIKSYLDSKKLPFFEKDSFSYEFNLILPNLTESSVKALKTAEVLKDLGINYPDYSPIILGYCKVIEIEIYDKILLPIKSQFATAASIATPKALSKLKSFIISPDNKSIELGTFASLLQQTIDNHSTDVVGKSLLENIINLPFKREANYLVSDLLHLTRNYRNRMAHKEIMTYEEMINCRAFVIEDGQKLGLLSKIVNLA